MAASWSQDFGPAFTVSLSLNLPLFPWDLRSAEPSSRVLGTSELMVGITNEDLLSDKVDHKASPRVLSPEKLAVFSEKSRNAL